MSNVIVDKNKIDILANAISCKSGEPVTMTLDEMVSAVDGIDTSDPTLETVTKTYTPSTSAVTDTITASAGYDGIEEVDVTVSAIPIASPYIYTTSVYSTENNHRVFKTRGAVSVDNFEGDNEGYINEGIYYGNYATYNAIAKNTSVTPTESAQTIGGGSYMMEGAVTVNAIPSTYVGSGITRRNADDLTVNGAYFTAPNGYYENSVTSQVTLGSEGTPTATKGSVSNHSISVTPSVTNTEGYIQGGSHTGTAVTVTASELASGDKSITENGSNIDVVGFSTVSVNVTSSGGSVTQDQDGYIILPSTGGGGGGGESWNWMGKNPTKVTDCLNEKNYLKDTVYAEWMPSSTMQTLSSTSSLTPYTTPDFDSYDYILYEKMHSHFEYDNNPTTARIKDYWAIGSIILYGYPYNIYDLNDDVCSTATSVTAIRYGIDYYDINNSESFITTNPSYGIYTNGISFGTADMGSITPKSFNVYARCSNSYFTTSSATAVNQNTSYYEQIIELWRVDRGTTVYGAHVKEIHDNIIGV